MNIQLSDHFDYKNMLRFTLPSIITMIFTSIYGVVDGFFVSYFVGKTSFAAVNFIMPVLMILGAFGFMFVQNAHGRKNLLSFLAIRIREFKLIFVPTYGGGMEILL